MKGLSNKWDISKLSEVCEITPSKKEVSILDKQMEVSFLPMASVSENGNITAQEIRKLKDVISGFTYFKEGDVLLAKITPCFENGKRAIARNLVNGIGFGSTEFHVLRPKESLTSEWVFYSISRDDFRNIAKSQMTGTAGQKRVPKRVVEEYKIPVPKIKEQEQITDAIETQFTRLDAVVKSLNFIKERLDVYRTSVLKAAFAGDLTDSVSSVDAKEIISRLKLERKSYWEKQQLLKFKANGRIPQNDKWKLRYKPPKDPDEKELSEIPYHWTWTNLENIAGFDSNSLKAGPFGSSLKKSFYVKKGYKIYGQEQVIRGDHEYGDYYIDEERFNKLKSCEVKAYDILISLVGTIGKVLIIPEKHEKGIINPRLIKISLHLKTSRPDYITYYLLSPLVRHFFKIDTHGGTMEILNLSILKRLPIPLPPPEIQELIVQEIESRFSVIDKVEQIVDASITKAEQLRKSILKSAFEGKLVEYEGDK